MINGKVWGSTQLIFKNQNFEVHRIEIKKGGFCSKHKHEYKHNLFFVESGELNVTVWKNDLEDVTEMFGGDTTDAKPGEFHQFKAVTDVIAYEIYYSEPISGDIVRETVGGFDV
jgi:quercetin dioxygenase-like cupin family protein